MHRRRTVTAIAAFVLAAVSLQSQDLPSVDTETAQTQIEQFELENTQLAASMLETERLITQTELDLETWQSWIEAIAKVAERLEEYAEKLLDVLAEIANKTVLEAAQSILERYGILRELIKEKAEELEAAIEDGESRIGEYRNELGLLDERIRRNRENIDLLTAAMAKSRSSEEALGGLIENLKDALDEAESLIEQP